MHSKEIRRAFLKYFQEKGHMTIPSSPIIPYDDPTLLFTNAGMNQFKDVFLGRSKRDYTRATSSQKCIRVGGKHNDLENVGHTTRHLTFFEMLGNFSFGDYFKKEAIAFAYEVTTNIFGFDPEKLWVSVYKEDDEAFSLWEKHMPTNRIVRLGDADNFWAMGDVGPCGPCTELLYDRGEKYGTAKTPYEDLSGERFFEFWNLVFMESERAQNGIQSPLPKKSVDTGAGLERVVSLKMDVDTVFQTDLLRGLIAEVETISRKKYSLENTDLAPAFHVISDHIRSLAFAIADGVTPSNTDRGYILRKILRRAVRYGRTLGLKKPFLSKILPRLEASMGEDFPELQKGQERIAEILTLEEEAFLRTLERGGNLFNQVISSPKDIISGDDAFKLKDTYGFPLEEIELIAKDEHLKIDLPRFHILEEEAKEKSRNARKKTIQEFDSNFFQDYMRTHKPSEFVGYTTTTSDAHILGIIVDGKFTDSLKGEGVLLLDKTPFYAEMGGQIGDTGTLSKQGHTFHVEDTFSPYPGVIAHSGKMNSGALKKGDKVKASIDEKRRQEIANNHTATHLLHLALQEVLGSHIQQAGSLVEPTRLRFDFNHHKPLSKNELIDIEKRVNALIRGSNEVSTYELTYDEAQKRSDIKQFFGDKYGEKVRVVDVGASKELCGGTHTHSCGTIGFFKIAKESSIAAGIRRMEATTGKYAEEFVLSEEKELLNAADLLKTTPHNLVEKITFLQEENKRFLASIKEMRKDQIEKLIEKVFHSKEAFGKSFLIAQEVSLDSDEIASFALTLIEKVKSGVVALGSKKEEKAHLLIAISEDLVKQKMHAGALIKEVAPLISGGGGGKPSIAQAGGKDPSGVPKALEKIREIVKC